MSELPIPSATVVVVRDAPNGLEVLLLERNNGKNIWVFPGGKVEGVDGSTRWMEGWEAAGRRAGVRETHEEAGLRLDGDALLPIARWVTPEVSPKRFDTLFFLGAVSHGVEVAVDGGEIASHRWMGPSQALAAQASGEIKLAPPTFVTVTWLAEHRSAAAAHAYFAEVPALVFRPRICRNDDGVNMLYPGDAGYEQQDPQVAGRRHRCVMDESGIRYVVTA